MAKPKKKPGRKPSEGVGRTESTVIRSTPAWKEWLIRFSAHCRLDMSDTVDQALALAAYQRGFEPPPPR
jgi:hypothetical protein